MKAKEIRRQGDVGRWGSVSLEDRKLWKREIGNRNGKIGRLEDTDTWVRKK